MNFTPEEIQRAHDAGMATLTRKMDAGGLDEQYLIGKLKKLTNAKGPEVQLRAIVEAFKLRGSYPDKNVKVLGDPNNPILQQLEVVFVSGANGKKEG